MTPHSNSQLRDNRNVHIVTADEVRKLGRQISQHIDSEKVLTCIREAELLDVKPNLGDDFFDRVLNFVCYQADVDGKEVLKDGEGGVSDDTFGETFHELWDGEERITERTFDPTFWRIDPIVERAYHLLLSGGTWEDRCGRRHTHVGLKTVIAYYVDARLVRIGDASITRYGLVTKTDEYSERVSGKEKVGAYNDMRLVADGYFEDVRQFLLALRHIFSQYRGNILWKNGRTHYNVIGE